jgi:predicted nucleic acid-binding Zn ribbon protein
MTENRLSGARKRKANPVLLTNILAPVLEDLGLGPDIRLEKLKNHWHEVVGTMNARNTHPLSLRDGILTVGVSSTVWITQARFYSSTFIKKINSFESEDGVDVREIHFILAQSQRSTK